MWRRAARATKRRFACGTDPVDRVSTSSRGLDPRTARTTQTQFVRWLRAQAADSEAARLEREPVFAPADSVTDRSASYATAIVDVGSGPRAFERAVGFPIDIIPLLAPADATAGDTLPFRLAIDGNPLSSLLVRVGLVRDPSASTPSATGESGETIRSAPTTTVYCACRYLGRGCGV